ncbi:MAG: serine hydrolase [Mariniphaga sp.]|nr:serine hydrolase [Mariniphaga sp.]
MMRLSTVLFLILILQVTLHAQENLFIPDLKKLDTYFEKCAEKWNIPGMSIGIVKNGKLVFAKGYGNLEIGKEGIPDENTLYAIASNTKAFTTAIIAILVQEGKLDWDDKVKDYIPYFELFDPWISDEVTVKDLLCHRVGLGTFSGDVIWYKSNLSSEEIIKRLKYLPMEFGFRDGYGYSNVMYITAGDLIKKVTGKTWGKNVQEKILNPLGMDRTIFSLEKLNEMENFATPHALVDGKNIPIGWENWEEVAALGGIISSVKDIGNWMIFNMENGIWGNDTILIPDSRNIIWKPHNTFTVNHTKENDFNNHFSGYGLGWSLNNFHGRLRISHGGGYDGMISAVNMIPDEKLGVVVLTNGMKAPTMAVTYYVLNAFLGLPEKDWSSEMLENRNKRNDSDNRVAERKESRMEGTKPSLPLHKYIGKFHAPIYGNILVSKEGEKLRLSFEYTPDLSAALEHWHYDVWKINWDNRHAWFDFGTVKYILDNNLKITGLEFDVPNNDIFFEELKPVKVE